MDTQPKIDFYIVTLCVCMCGGGGRGVWRDSTQVKVLALYPATKISSAYQALPVLTPKCRVLGAAECGPKTKINLKNNFFKFI